MRELRFVEVSDDGTHLIVASTDELEQYGVLVEPALLAALQPPAATAPTETTPAEAPVETAAAPPEPEAHPTQEPAKPAEPIVPRDIQVRVRAGESPEDVAASLGVPVERIARFAAPVMDERRRITEEARRARARHGAPSATADSKIVVFGETVDARFSAHGIVATDVTWDAQRRDDGAWVVLARWIGGDSEHEARWIFQRSTRTVTPDDDTATDLLSDRPIRPIAPPPPAPPRLVVAPPLAPGVVAFPPMPDAHTGPIAVVEDVFDQEAPTDHLPPAPPPAKPAFARHTDAPADQPQVLDFDAPPLPLGINEPAVQRPEPKPAGRREPSDEERAARSRIPSWDDILLGVRRKSD